MQVKLFYLQDFSELVHAFPATSHVHMQTVKQVFSQAIITCLNADESKNSLILILVLLL